MIRKAFAALASSIFLAGLLPSAALVSTVTVATTIVQVIAADLAQADQTTCYKGSFSTTCTGTNGTTTCYTGSFSTTCSGANGTTTCYNGSFSTTCSGTNGTTTCYNGSFSTTCSGSGGILPLGSKTGGTLGGSTGGTLGGSTGGTITTSCSKAPEIPNLAFSNLSDGVQFTSSAKATGDRATGLYYSYTYFDGFKNAWDTWSSWFNSSPTGVISFKATNTNNKTYVAFAVYASNSCGQSSQARESSNQMGLKLPSSSAISTTGGTDAAAEFIDANAASLDAINAAKEAASQFSKERAKCVATYPSMDVTTLTKYSDYCLELDSKYASLVQKIYAFNATKFVTVDQANNGTDTANSYAEEADILVARMQDITSTLVAASYKVAIKKTTINCVKGKLIKKVTASKPVCPVGYKKK